jgi:hypothetical protein
MDSNGIKRLRPAARIGVIAAALAAAATLLLSNIALAATGIGSAAGNLACLAGFDVVQTSSGGPSYTVPAGGGSITSWSTLAGGPGLLGQANLEVWRFKSPGLYTLVGISASETLTANTLNTFPVNIKVQAGDLLGLHVVGPMLCLQKTTAATDTIAESSVPTPPVGADQILTPDFAPYELNVAATIGASAPGPGNCDKSGKSTANAQCRPKPKRHHDPQER